MTHSTPTSPMAHESTILVVDDQPDLLDSLKLTLETAGYRVVAASNGADALVILHREPVDLILADIAMPQMNGYLLYERVRENPAWVPIPFLFLTVRTMDSDIRYGKELGVDDYLTKPIQPEDLLAAIHGRLRRARELAAVTGARAGDGVAGDGGYLEIGRLRIEPGEHRVWLDDAAIRLSAKEFALLEHLGRRAGKVVPAQDLIRVTHGLETDYVEAGTLLRPLIRTLRRKLGYDVGDMGCIENVRGVGYRLTPL